MGVAREKRIEYAKQILQKEMLPHVGITEFCETKKAYFIGYTITPPSRHPNTHRLSRPSPIQTRHPFACRSSWRRGAHLERACDQVHCTQAAHVRVGGAPSG